MGTTLYGRFDHLVIELGLLDAARLRRRRVPVPLDSIVAVRTAVRPVDGGLDHVLELGARRHPALVLELAPGSFASRIVVHHPAAAELVDDLVRRGVGATNLAAA
jgi:hypothetical protein